MCAWELDSAQRLQLTFHDSCLHKQSLFPLGLPSTWAYVYDARLCIASLYWAYLQHGLMSTMPAFTLPNLTRPTFNMGLCLGCSPSHCLIVLGLPSTWAYVYNALMSTMPAFTLPNLTRPTFNMGLCLHCLPSRCLI